MRNALLLAFGLCLLVACHPRVNLGYDEPVESDDLVEVSFDLALSDFHSGSLKSYPTEEAERARRQVIFNGLRVVFYSTKEEAPDEPDVVVYAFDKDIKASFGGVYSGSDYAPDLENNGASVGFRVRSNERIKVGDYLVYYFTSANAALKEATSIGRPFTALQETMSYDPKSDFRYNLLLNSLYFNTKPIKVTKEFFGEIGLNKVYTLPKAELSAVNALLSVKWEDAVQDNRYLILGDQIVFYPDVQNLKYRLFPEMDETIKRHFNFDYPIDANYTGLKEKSIDDLRGEFLYANQRTDMLGNYSSHDPQMQSKYRPIPENTMAASETSAKLITKAIVEVRMLPKVLKERLTSEQLKDERLSWVSYNGEVYEGNEFLEMYKKLSTKKVKTSEEQELYQAASRIIKEDKLLTTGYQDDTIRFYKSSKCYYSIPITHKPLKELGNTATNGGFFGVVRNHHYEIRIKSFATIGATEPSYFSYDQDYLKDRQVDFSTQITNMTNVVQEIEELY